MDCKSDVRWRSNQEKKMEDQVRSERKKRNESDGRRKEMKRKEGILKWKISILILQVNLHLNPTVFLAIWSKIAI